MKEDSSEIARLINKASRGIVEFLFHDLIKDFNPTDMISFSLKENKNHHTFKNCIIAEIDGSIRGMIFFYPSQFQGLDEETRTFVPKERLDHLMEIFQKSIPNSIYIDALCVDDQYNNKGIATELISRAKKNATKKGYESLSLIVMKENTKALSLYKKFGFNIIDDIAIKPHKMIQSTKGAYLMKF